MCISCRGFVVASYVPFWFGVGDTQLCAFLVGGCWLAVMGLSCRRFVGGSHVPFLVGDLLYAVM
jgi:hypothetical protein